MRTRHFRPARREAAAAAVAVVLACTAVGCGDGGEGDGGDRGPAASSSADGGKGGRDREDGARTDVPDASETLAVIKGSDDLVLTVHSARRDSGGFVTVNAEVKNDGDESFYGVSAWRGYEQEIVRSSGRSVGGAMLVDQKGKKRYYVLRDTEGRCLCTTGLTKVEAGKSLAVFMQFPAPPESTGEVDFQMPTFPSTPIKISG
ncbi:hypothetical protein [Streptomyces sp. NPDC047108]|uniref:hypothetical protein n=1 Tax=Streptomyces sp. NPDC047108 TaxID=3155025 RepID=UPI0033D87BF4